VTGVSRAGNLDAREVTGARMLMC